MNQLIEEALLDCIVELRSRDEWRDLVAHKPHLLQRDHILKIVDHARLQGVQSSFLGPIPPEQINVVGTNFRETVTTAGLNSRLRAVLEFFLQHPKSKQIYNIRIFGHEGTTSFALALRGKYPKYLGSEYAIDSQSIHDLYPIPAIDIMASGLPASTFDIVLSNEVLEHIPDLDAGLRDTARILTPGGWFIATFPFAYQGEETVVKATIRDGHVVHLMEPEYHGNPADPIRGSLVFQIPSWDVIPRAVAAGFKDAYFVFWSSMHGGITGADEAGIFIFVGIR